nr:MAG TPA: hypothetical protein [Caudoviricetes sp.]
MRRRDCRGLRLRRRRHHHRRGDRPGGLLGLGQRRHGHRQQ